MSKIKILIFTIALTKAPHVYCLGFKESLRKAAFEKNVWIPSATALIFSLTDYDGRITKWASDKKTVFGSKESASQYSDLITFYYFPTINILANGVSHYRGNRHENMMIHHFSFLMAPLFTYLINRVLKDRTGRIRPDASNDLSFPSAHTSIASSMNEELFYQNQSGSNSSFAKGFYYFNEGLVGSVALARMEAKRHHFTDVLVGYSLGKFVSHFIHNYFFDQNNNMKISVDINTNDKVSGVFKWSFE